MIQPARPGDCKLDSSTQLMAQITNISDHFSAFVRVGSCSAYAQANSRGNRMLCTLKILFHPKIKMSFACCSCAGMGDVFHKRKRSPITHVPHSSAVKSFILCPQIFQAN
eukprot:TRINITY_DN8524_c0_g1_i1.p2 TRINITY_DN8524_c0_g1~~TRINITY_DN8524_c0_g1_i1.p2  ORF type:complete len:110 (-),score=8.04 TRINITY_DN8524_c0_g1_i1:237-566(-)